MAKRPAYNKKTQEIPRTYFRLTADYTLKETGEDIRFDYVVACGGKATRWTFTTPSVLRSRYPQLMMQATSTGAAVGIRTPDACRNDLWELGRIPDDFIPTVLWYPDVNDLGLAISFETEKAYQGPYARLAFHGARLERVEEADWRAWREKAAADYEQIGAVPGPWGMAWFAEDKEFLKLIESRSTGRRIEGQVCSYVAVFELTDEMYDDAEAHFRPEGSGRYWIPRYRKDDPVQVSPRNQFPEQTARGYLEMKYRRDEDRVFYGGHLWDFSRPEAELGVRRIEGPEILTENGCCVMSKGGGAITSRALYGGYYHDVFPLFDNTHPINSPQDASVREFTTHEALSGLALCSDRKIQPEALIEYWTGKAPSIEPVTELDIDRSGKEFHRTRRPVEVYMNGELVAAYEPSKGIVIDTVFDHEAKTMFYERIAP